MSSPMIAFSDSSEYSDEGLDRSSLDHSLPSLCIPPMKIFHDIVHPHMELPFLCYQIINTPQFHRLRNLKQLGLCYYVYPSASHNRFEHCIGTSYIAGKYCRTLQRNQPELNIDVNDILCVEIAGLCHDIGHGPFSHLWEEFMQHFATSEEKFFHEEMSFRMFDYLVEENKLWDAFVTAGLDKRDLIFIKEAIFGRPLPGSSSFQGRDSKKYFLYQIVSNDETKIDVDKFDYMLRDSKQLNISTAFDYERVLDNSRVVQVEENGESRCKIVYRQKIRENLEDLFKGRYRMHQTVYQHRVIKIMEYMLIEGFLAADFYFEVTGHNGTIYKLSTACNDPSAYVKLSDVLFDMIVNSGNGGPKAEAILKRILRRDLYKHLGYFTEFPNNEQWSGFVKKYENLILLPSKFNYGKDLENPLNASLFYEKNKPDVTFHLQFSPPPVNYKFHVIYKSEENESSESVAMDRLKDDLLNLAGGLKIAFYFE